MPHWLQVLLVVTFVASVLQSLITAYDGNTLRDDPSYRPEGRGGILYTLRSGTPSYTHENKRGDVVAKTDGSGALTCQIQYDAFGKPIATSGSTPDRQKANSQDDDPTGLSYYHHRYLDRDAGIWLTRDPAGFIDGPNLYTYVRQNPWTNFDIDGLMTQSQYQDDLTAKQAQQTAILKEANGHKPPEKLTQVNADIQRDKDGIDRIENYVGEFNAINGRIGNGVQITKSQKDQLDDNSSQFTYLTQYHVTAEIGRGAAGQSLALAGGAVLGKAAEALAPYLSKVLGAFSKPVGDAIGESPSSRILGKNMQDAGEVRPPETAAHHIVAGTDPRAAEARAILDQEGIGINDADNGSFLPRFNSSANPTGAQVHSTVHTDIYYDAVNSALRNAQPGTARDVLSDIDDQLQQGTFPH